MLAIFWPLFATVFLLVLFTFQWREDFHEGESVHTHVGLPVGDYCVRHEHQFSREIHWVGHLEPLYLGRSHYHPVLGGALYPGDHSRHSDLVPSAFQKRGMI